MPFLSKGKPAVKVTGKRRVLPTVWTRASVILLFVFTLLVLPLSAAAETAQSDLVLVRADEVIGEDLYAIGNRIDIQGRVEGDLMVAAFEEISISGEVTGDVVGLASRVVISGRVGGRVSVAAGNVVVNGSIGSDLLAAGWQTVTGPESLVTRDMLVFGWRLDHGGTVGANLAGNGRTMVITGTVEGGVDVSVSDLVLEQSALIGGNMAYRSAGQATVNEGAEVGGTLVRRNPVTPNIRVRALRLLTVLVVVVVIAALGLAAQWSWPRHARRAAEAVRSSFWRCFLFGWLVLAAPVVLVIMAGAFIGLSPPAAGLPLLVVFVPLIVAGVGVVMAGGLVAAVPVLTAIGWRVVPARSLAAAFVVGILIAVLAAVVPLLRLVLFLVALPVGLGGWLRSGSRAARPAAIAGD
jgi:hypothetical protein